MVSSVLDLKCIKIRDEAIKKTAQKIALKTTTEIIEKIGQFGVYLSEEQIQELLDYALAEVEKEY